MVRHIYGSSNIITYNERPNMFMKELRMYLDYLKDKIEGITYPLSKKDEKSLKPNSEKSL